MKFTDRFTPRPPRPLCWGFDAGVLRVQWTKTEPAELGHGCIYAALVVECRTDSGTLPRDQAIKALYDLVVQLPNGEIGRITGVEAFLTPAMFAGSEIGIRIGPVEP